MTSPVLLLEFENPGSDHQQRFVQSLRASTFDLPHPGDVLTLQHRREQRVVPGKHVEPTTSGERERRPSQRTFSTEFQFKCPGNMKRLKRHSRVRRSPEHFSLRKCVYTHLFYPFLNFLRSGGSGRICKKCCSWLTKEAGKSTLTSKTCTIDIALKTQTKTNKQTSATFI